MSLYLVTDEELSAVADAIRDKSGEEGSLTWPSGFASAIGALQADVGDIIQSFATNQYSDIMMSDIAYVKSGLFWGLSNLRTVSLPRCVAVYDYAFQNCTNLSSIDLPLCQSLSFSAFYGCTALTTVSLPKCRTLGMSAFANCTSLVSINLPSVNDFLYSTFAGATSLKTVSLPNCRNELNGTFYQCSALTTVDIPNVRALTNAFYSCSSLQQLTAPQVSSIGYMAFGGCKALRSLYLTSSSVVTLTVSNAFITTPMVTTSYLGYYGSIFVPASLVSAYQASTNWVTIKDRIAAIPT